MDELLADPRTALFLITVMSTVIALAVVDTIMNQIIGG